MTWDYEQQHPDAYARARVQADADGLPLKNLCAATASRHYIMQGVLRSVRYMTRDLVAKLKRIGWQLNPHMALVGRGHLIVCQDLNNIAGPDHVCIAVAVSKEINGVWHCMVVDNYGAEPYLRNLGAGKRTPMDYSLVVPGPADTAASLVAEAHRLLEQAMDKLS